MRSSYIIVIETYKDARRKIDTIMCPFLDPYLNNHRANSEHSQNLNSDGLTPESQFLATGLDCLLKEQVDNSNIVISAINSQR